MGGIKKLKSFFKRTRVQKSNPALAAQTNPFHVRLKARLFEAEEDPPEAPANAFDETLATRINRARMEHLESLKLPFTGKSVIDVGCGVGHLAQFFVNKGCKVLCVDGRAENIASLKLKYPGLEAKVSNADHALKQFGQFDCVFCYGLLYHLENPLLTMRTLAEACKDVLLLETLVCDAEDPLLFMVDEPKRNNQALQGIGCRPSPSYVAMGLNRSGFRYVYAPKNQPQHEDFQFEWKNNREFARDGHNLRCIFISSKTAIKNETLVPLLDG